MRDQDDKKTFVECVGFDVKGTLAKIKRSSDFMSPIFEALSNALDATEERGEAQEPVKITLELSALSQDSETRRLDAVEIQDFGAGFTQENYRRFLTLNDGSKSLLNKGSGRVQLIKAFDRADYVSVYYDERDGVKTLMKRAFSLSASTPYLNRNALVCETSRVEKADALKDAQGTTLRLLLPFNDDASRKLEKTSAEDVKQRVLTRFFFRLNGDKLAPKIEIVLKVNGEEKERASIGPNDRAVPRKPVRFEVPCKFLITSGSTRKFVKTGKTETFVATGYAIKNASQTRNVEAFVSRGEVVADAKLGLANSDEKIDGFNYVVAITGDAVDSSVLESRDGLALRSDKDFRDEPLFDDEREADVSIDDVRKEARDACAQIFPELEEKRKTLDVEIDRIGERFGFAKSTVDSIRRGTPLNASTKDVLKRLFDKEARNAAKTDASLDELLNGLNALDPTASDYQERLKENADRLFEIAPDGNKNALAHYFARRKIVLDVLDKALKRELDVQNNKGRNQEESVFHNVLFNKKSTNPASSDLWILNEEFVYFSGTSDKPLCDVEYKGEKLLAPLEEIPQKYREYAEARGRKRPDVLLFPDEGKCVLIELKAPGVDVSDFIPQINKYAGFLYNYSAKGFNLSQFYACLIGGEFDPQDVRAVDPEYRLAERFGFMFATKNVAPKTPGERDGELYAEIHTYRSFYERAVARNKTFLDLLLTQIE